MRARRVRAVPSRCGHCSTKRSTRQLRPLLRGPPDLHVPPSSPPSGGSQASSPPVACSRHHACTGPASSPAVPGRRRPAPQLPASGGPAKAYPTAHPPEGWTSRPPVQIACHLQREEPEPTPAGCARVEPKDQHMPEPAEDKGGLHGEIAPQQMRPAPGAGRLCWPTSRQPLAGIALHSCRAAVQPAGRALHGALRAACVIIAHGRQLAGSKLSAVRRHRALAGMGRAVRAG
jgi:hypothetical protein